MSVCTNLKMVEKYFNVDEKYKLTLWNSSNFIDISYDTSNILNSDFYYGLKSYKKEAWSKDKYIISKHTVDIHTLCGEGNIVWVTEKSKVGSTTIDSCMFVIIILNDNSKICIHHNMLDEYNMLAEFSGEYFYNIYDNNKDTIVKIFEKSGITSINIVNIYLISPLDIKESYNKYYNLYKTLILNNDSKINLIQGCKNYDIIVNHKNEIQNIQKKNT